MQPVVTNSGFITPERAGTCCLARVEVGAVCPQVALCLPAPSPGTQDHLCALRVC
jgi:hypothetical protein